MKHKSLTYSKTGYERNEKLNSYQLNIERVCCRRLTKRIKNDFNQI